MQLKVTDPRKYAFPSQHFIWYLYWKFHCVRLKPTMNFSSDCFQKLFKNSLDNKNCNCQMIPCFSMTRISFFFLIRQDDICQLPIQEPRGQRDCKGIHFIKPFQGEEPSAPKVTKTSVRLTKAALKTLCCWGPVPCSQWSHLEDTHHGLFSFIFGSKWTALLMFALWL